jgi:ribonuclease HI
MVTQARSPHFLLYSEAFAAGDGASRWRFVLQSVGSDDQFAAGDLEFDSRISRLELLAVVRGLEALDQPSHLTLLTRSRYVTRGIRRELDGWRDRKWHWERFERHVPMRDHDLWRRVDRALQFHDVTCITWPIAAQSPWSAVADASWTAESTSPDSALLIVPREPSRPTRQAASGRLVQALNSLREGVLAPISAILRPAFTRAA